MNEAEIRVLIAEDHDQVRARIQRIVDAMPGIVVVGAASNGLTAVSTAKRLDPDVILMDISMPVLDGIHATRQIVDLDSEPVSSRSPHWRTIAPSTMRCVQG